ncbi:hypothetical protein BGW80DRAFT_1252871 [Lactifluus volemus]|nr:hypothetical protein BGW80DRAFT_1252871 [Lactifluus volemus]
MNKVFNVFPSWRTSLTMSAVIQLVHINSFQEGIYAVLGGGVGVRLRFAHLSVARYTFSLVSVPSPVRIDRLPRAVLGYKRATTKIIPDTNFQVDIDGCVLKVLHVGGDVGAREFIFCPITSGQVHVIEVFPDLRSTAPSLRGIIHYLTLVTALGIYDAYNDLFLLHGAIAVD